MFYQSLDRCGTNHLTLPRINVDRTAAAVHVAPGCSFFFFSRIRDVPVFQLRAFGRGLGSGFFVSQTKPRQKSLRELHAAFNVELRSCRRFLGRHII